MLSNSDETSAATTIQKVARGYLDRKAFLPKTLYPQYAKLCDNKQIKSMPKADQGKNNVYLPEGYSVVIKRLSPRRENQTARRNAIQRFQSTHQVRAILRQIDASHLVIPRSHLCKNFLVEERLSIVSKRYECSQLYWNNLPKFEQPVREMVRLFSKINIPYLVGLERCVEGSRPKILFIRYDNIPFLVVNEKNTIVIKIGLIDLERAGEENTKSMESRLKHLTLIFPYHVHIIKDEAKKLNLPYDQKILEKASEIGIHYLFRIINPPENVTFEKPKVFSS